MKIGFAILMATIGALGLCGWKARAQVAASDEPREYVVIDTPSENHSIRRETTIDRLQGTDQGKVRFRIVRKYYADTTTHFNTGGNMFDPPIVMGDLVIYPGRYSRLSGNDAGNSARLARVMMFSDAAETVLLGVPIDDKLGGGAPSAGSTIEKTIEIVPRARTGAWLGMKANNIAEHEVTPAAKVSHPELLVDLGNGKEGFVGTQVDEVDANGPAARAGIHAGDLILTLDSIHTDRDRKLEIITDYSQQGRVLTCLLMRSSAGETVVLSVQVTPQSQNSTTNAH
jgi:hypothetical protein